MFPIEFEIHTYKHVAESGLELSEAQKKKIMQLNELDDIRKQVVEPTPLVQNKERNAMMDLSRRNFFI